MAQIAILAVMAIAALNKGAQARKVAYGQAEDYRDARNRSMAATTAAIAGDKIVKERIYSRAIAVSAASGAGVDDPGVINILGDLNAEGDYRIFSQLYTGETEAEGYRVKSENAMKEGDAALNSGYIEAATTVLSAYGAGAFGGSTKIPSASSTPWTTANLSQPSYLGSGGGVMGLTKTYG